MTVLVKNWREINRAFAKTEDDIRDGWRDARREIAEPVARDSETMSLGEIRHMPRSPEWAEMRIGVTQKAVYVAPRQRGVYRRGRQGDPRQRRNLAGLLMDRAMQPALDRNQAVIEHRFEHLLDVAADRFNRG